MTRSFLALMLAAVFPAMASAQLTGGSVTGTVADEQGGVLPGVSMTLQGTDVTQSSTTDAEGHFRFLNLAPGAYKLTASLDGFATIVQDKVVVEVGRSVDLPLQMKLASLAVSITVSGVAPNAIIDVKQTGTSTNVTQDELQQIPTSRDPFAIMRSVPGVLIDRVNVGGNETGQQSNFASKGTRPQDAVWTLDGIVVTDMAAVGASPTYFNFDNFEEIQVATAGQDIKQPTGGMGINLIVKRGTNQFHGSARGYFDNGSLSWSNVPDELRAIGIDPARADHNQQISDYGGEIGGPIYRDKAWFYGSYSLQDVRLVRRAGQLIDRTKLKNPDAKVNWQATGSDMVGFLYFDGFKIKDGRSPGVPGILFDAGGATWHQDNAYTNTPLNGLWKISDDRTFGATTFLSGKFAYYNTGFILSPEGGLGVGAGRDFTTATSYGSLNQNLNQRPQIIVNADANSFLNWRGGSHDIKYGFGWRRAEGTSTTVWPGDGILAIENSPSDLRAQLFRQAAGTNRALYLDLYVGDTITINRATIDAGVRYDRQWGLALSAMDPGNPAFPDVVPGIVFGGYTAPFFWNTFSPRTGFTYALDDTRKTVAHASYSRYAGQLNTGAIGFTNATTTAGSATYRWVDLDGDHLAQPNEVLLNQFITSGGGFNPANPTAAVSSNVIDPNLKPPVTQTVVAGVNRELMANMALEVNYTYTRTSHQFGNFANAVTPRVGLTPGLSGDYAPGPLLTGTLPGGAPYSVPTYIPNQAKVTAGGGGFFETSVPGYYVDYHGVEVSLVKRLSNRWMGRVGFSYNNAREHFASAAGMYNANGNPTRTLTEPLVDGGQYAPQSGGSGSGNIYINAKWQFNANGLYQLPKGFEVSGNVFGRQGYPFPLFRQTSLGADSGTQVLVTPTIDSLRYPNLWDTDARVTKTFHAGSVYFRLIGDLFNVFNANTVLVRNNNVLSPTFNQIAQNLSPRIFRAGVVVGF